MALSSSYTLCLPCYSKFKYPLHIRSQTFNHDGRSAKMVDANIGVLRERMAEMRMKERLENCCRNFQNGWDYQIYGYNYDQYKRVSMVCESLKIISSAGSALVFVFLSGSFFIFLVSILIHLINMQYI
ncbi:uncharacterized protein LOC126671308 [Mercurialis annua]|uniref:uncharacterized protein LOC126671308 n=1 Tax=Mercurialis annua TaxID=3986 RepID=UPI002160B9F4|nr:uncharacterized protein LOC126671308 [Mercurialis annua]